MDYRQLDVIFLVVKRIVTMPPISTPITVDDFYSHASRILPRHAFDYYRGGAGLEKSLGLNKTAYGSWRLRPRMLRDIRERDTSTTILGQKINAPIGIAPTAMQCMAHSAGETANAQGKPHVRQVLEY